MSELRLNKIHFKILNPCVSVWLSIEEIPDFSAKDRNIFKGSLPAEFDNSTKLYYSFRGHEDAVEFVINVNDEKYFLKPYVDFVLTEYFLERELLVRKDFINGIQVWEYNKQEATVNTYDRITVRQVSVANLSKLELLISYDGKSLVSRQPLATLRPNASFSRYIYEGAIHDFSREPIQAADQAFPILSYGLKKEMNIPFEGFAGKNTYLEYYTKISLFYDAYLRGRTLGENISFFSEGFIQADVSQILHTSKVSNALKFNNGSDFNIFTGLKKYGPYKVPETNNLRFIFIYKKGDQYRQAANKLYIALKNGIASSFPGIKDYVKIHFELAEENKIVLETNEPLGELRDKLDTYKFNPEFKYFAIYLTDHRRFEFDDENDEEYYTIKYLLLQKEVLSQFIYHRNVDTPNFKFHLPNIAVAMLAKLGGVPWKLDTFSNDKMVIGFGVRRLNHNTYLGNTLCFKDDGEFYKFETYQRADIRTMGDALRESIERVLAQETKLPQKLVIHYYKTLSDDEAREIELVLKNLNFEIPFVVLTINDTKSKDYIFFDVAYKDVMPVSGTILEIKPQSEYLLANNERHSETQLYSIRKFAFPLKVKINRPSNTLYDTFDVRELLDQVYGFSRIYWKSISQVSLPVTIAYSKIVADLAAHFPEHRLPEKEIAHSNLWFL